MTQNHPLDFPKTLLFLRARYQLPAAVPLRTGPTRVLVITSSAATCSPISFKARARLVMRTRFSQTSARRRRTTPEPSATKFCTSVATSSMPLPASP